MTLYASLCAEVAAQGLACRGGFQPAPDEDIPRAPDGAPALTVVLLGFTGAHHFERFAASAELADGAPHPLDRWSRRLIDALARRHGASALYPFGGPPWLPFQRWAQRAEPVYVSPINLLIHPVYGLWHAYRGALAFAERLELPPRTATPSPCASCAAKPCLHTCPVAALGPAGLDVARCHDYLEHNSQAACYDVACQARASCPVGAEHRYGPTQARFHLQAFLRAAGADQRAPRADTGAPP